MTDLWRHALALVMLSTASDLPRADRSRFAVASIADAGDQVALICTQADMTAAIVRGVERAVDSLLARPDGLAAAAHAAATGAPWRAASVRMDAASLLSRVGEVAADT